MIVPFERLNWLAEVIDAFVENNHVGPEIGDVGLGVCDMETGLIVAEAPTPLDRNRRNVNAEIALIAKASEKRQKEAVAAANLQDRRIGAKKGDIAQQHCVVPQLVEVF